MTRRVSSTVDGVILGLCIFIGGYAIYEHWDASLDGLAWLALIFVFSVILVAGVVAWREAK